MNLTENARAICPFYEHYEGYEIQCESRIHRARQVFAFDTQVTALWHKRNYCDQYKWCLCPYAEKLIKVYEVEPWEKQNMTGRK